MFLIRAETVIERYYNTLYMYAKSGIEDLCVSMHQMKNDFKKMEDEMDHLATNMAKITTFSASISDTLQDRRHQITKLAGVHTLLKKVCMICVFLLLFVGVCFFA